ncbi:MAG: hypothetical protein M3Q98_01810 [Actinomycetota bacterium]|nr:hypothetical protein [Actinomycetota bacterium]
MPGRVSIAALMVLLTVALGGTAFAYWSATGDGSGSGETGTTVSVTLSPGAPTVDLFPGGQSSVILTVTNPNASSIRVGSLSLDTSQGANGFSVDAGHSGCDVSVVSFTTQTTGWTVPAKVGAVNGTLPVTLTNALSMSTSAANACQGATLTIFLAAGP